MARAEWRGKPCSYKRTTFILFAINIVVAFYVLRILYSSIYPYNELQKDFKDSPDQIRKIEELIRIRKTAEPVELVKVVKQISKKILEEKVVELSPQLKQKITDEILVRLRNLNGSSNVTVLRETVESWRKEKLKEVKKLTHSMTSSTTISPKEAGMLKKALENNWPDLLEATGLWIPVEVINGEHNDKPEGAEDLYIEILPGRQLPAECHAELHTDYGGAAVRWGLTHPKESAYDCCMACLEHAKHAKPEKMKCNVWVYCPSETGCYSPDKYEHNHQECWLKYAEKLKVNFKDTYSESYRNSHPNAPVIVPWVSGFVS